MHAEHNLKVAGHVAMGPTFELITWNFYWRNIEIDIPKYSNMCDNCQRTNGPRHTKHGSLHALEQGCKPCTHICMDSVTDSPESDSTTTRFVVVDLFTTIAHYIRIKKEGSPTVART